MSAEALFREAESADELLGATPFTSPLPTKTWARISRLLQPGLGDACARSARQRCGL